MATTFRCCFQIRVWDHSAKDECHVTLLASFLILINYEYHTILYTYVASPHCFSGSAQATQLMVAPGRRNRSRSYELSSPGLLWFCVRHFFNDYSRMSCAWLVCCFEETRETKKSLERHHVASHPGWGDGWPKRTKAISCLSTCRGHSHLLCPKGLGRGIRIWRTSNMYVKSQEWGSLQLPLRF